MITLFSSETTGFKSLSGKDFKTAYAASAQPVLIDVRTPGEFASGSIDRALNIDLTSADFEERIKTLDPNGEYFLFCRSGNRSAVACGIMAKEGLKVYNLKGGVGSWPR